MATLEKRSGSYRVIFYFGGRRIARSLKTDNAREALASMARLDDNLRRVELGLLDGPESVDLATFLLSDGKADARQSLPAIRTLRQLFDNYFVSIGTPTPFPENPNPIPLFSVPACHGQPSRLASQDAMFV